MEFAAKPHLDAEDIGSLKGQILPAQVSDNFYCGECGMQDFVVFSFDGSFCSLLDVS